MALTNEQVQSILRIYDERQAKNRKIHNKRYEEVISRIPEYSELEKKISQNALKFAKMGINSEENPSKMQEMLRDANLPVMEEKKKLLCSNGFPPDYLLPIYDCRDCQDTGYIKTPEGNIKKCRCYFELSEKFRSEGMQREEIPKNAVFDNFNYNYYSDTQTDSMTQKTHRQNITDIVSRIREYINNYPDEFCNFLIYGNVGVGKTYLTYCIANELKEKNFSFLHLTSYAFFDLVEQKTFGGDSLGSKNVNRQRFNEMLDAELLILDDLGTENSNSFTTSQLYLCINERQRRQKPTIITTNLSLEDLKRVYGERIFSRVIGNYSLIRIMGDDLRYKKFL